MAKGVLDLQAGGSDLITTGVRLSIYLQATSSYKTDFGAYKLYDYSIWFIFKYSYPGCYQKLTTYC